MAYTMFISGLRGGKQAIDNRSRLRNVDDSEIVMIFDSVDNYNISLQNEKTQYPIESRSNVTDHVFSPDGKFSFVGRITTAPYLVRKRVEWDINTDEKSPKTSERINKAYEVLKTARDSRAGVSLEFEEGSLSNYVISSVEMSREGPTDQMVFNISLTEMRNVAVGKTVLAMNVGDGLKNAAKTSKNLGNKYEVPPSLAKSQRKETVTTNLTEGTTAQFKEENLVVVVPEGTAPDKLKSPF